MPKPSPKLDPVFQKTVARMLATPPQPKKTAAEKKPRKATKRGRGAAHSQG